MSLLSALVAELPGARVVGPADVEIAGLTADSRAVEPGWLFIAYQGKERDLHDFVPSAVAAGASAVAVEREVEAARGITQIIVPDGRAAEGLLAAAFFGYPSRRLGVIGVTGTDGKTTTTTLVHSILNAAGLRAGMITTVAAKIGDRSIDTGLHTTTPRALEVQRLLAGLVEAGA
ncbi:MAG: UDP-N-acetylmuramoyl-L-alanyl-D-glutamate--2,6-diaminopimelate ligase, partial [Chloroflexi bacterium]|nr:UDP-N-acetylmuramoyl-L-alanyl-D-glutamate--2,6-diaminopimelate ligase [Chloroflexota bacterium]